MLVDNTRVESVNYFKNQQKKMDNKSSTSSRSPEDVEGEPVAKKARLVLKTIIYDESVANQWLDEPPLKGMGPSYHTTLEFERFTLLEFGSGCQKILLNENR